MRGMGVGVFGPVHLEGTSLSPRERMVLSALVLRAGRLTTTDELAEAVWGDEPPETWAKQLQASIGRVRVAIGRNLIETTPGGYALRVDPDMIDVERFERLAASARQHLDGGDPARAIDAADRALTLARGAAYADLAAWPPAVVESERLDEVRMGLEEVRLDARLQLGEHAASVADAERLVRESPLRERRWTVLATALYRSGRQADALAAIRAAKERLAQELGAEPGDELRELELAILRHDDSLELGETPAAPSGTCPYRGLAAFGVEDEDDFFGRAADTAAALARLIRSRFLAVSGASGSGKSSLVRAGLVPALQRRGDSVTLLTPERDLDVRVRNAVRGAGRADVLVVDQFEEVFHSGEADVDAAARAIAEAAANGTAVVLVVRSDFLDDCAAHPDLAPLVAEGVHLVGPMGSDALREAIEQPAKRAGLRLEPGLVELLLRDAAGEAGALPHLSHALVETWLRREGATLTVAGYEASGGISGAIAQSADRLYQSMDAEQRALCRSVLLRLVALAPDGSPVRRRVPSRPLRSDAARSEVLTLLSRSRLVSAEADSVEVAHESLATAWPRLHSWLDEDAESSRLLTAVAAAAEAWAAAGRPDDDLYRGTRLQSALEWRDAAPRDLTDVETSFLDASSARATAARDELAERARRDRLQNRRLRVLLTAAAALIVLLVGAGSVAVVASREAATQRDSAMTESLVNTALAVRASELDVSALLAAEAYRRWPDDPRTRAGLMGVLQSADGFLGHATIDGSEDVEAVAGAVIPGTGDALVLDPEGDLGVFDIATGEREGGFDLALGAASPWPPLPSVRVSADGTTAALLRSVELDPHGEFSWGRSVASELIVVDLASGRLHLGPERLELGAGALAIRGDGDIVAVADSTDGRVVIFEVATGVQRGIVGERLAPITVDGFPTALAFTPTGELLVGRLDDTLSAVDPETGAILRTHVIPGTAVNVAIAVTSGGTIITSGDRSVAAVDGLTGGVIWSDEVTGPQPGTGCSDLAISEAIGTVYCAGPGDHVVERDLADGAPTGRRIDQAGGTVAVTDSGTRLVTIHGWRRAVSNWRLDGGDAVGRVIAPGMEIMGSGYSPSGERLLLRDRIPGQPWEEHEEADLEAVVWDIRADRRAAVIEGPIVDPQWAGEDRIVAFFPEAEAFRIVDVDGGSVIATLPTTAYNAWTSSSGTRVHVAVDREGDADGANVEDAEAGPSGEIWTYDAGSGERVEPTIGFDGQLWGIAPSPDGSRLALALFDPEAVALTTSVVDAETGVVVSPERIPTGSFAMVSDSEVISPLADSRVARFRVDTADQVGTLSGPAGGTNAIVVSGDGETVLMASAAGTATVHDLRSGVRLGDPIQAEFPKLRPDGAQIAMDVEGGVLIWEMDADTQFDAVCRIAGRDLSAAEWATYLADRGERRSTCELD